MAQFPSSVATDSNLYVAVNTLATTLVGALTSSGGNYSGTEIQVADTSGFPSVGFITIDTEAISYSGLASAPPRFTGISRGADGTIAAAHNNGVATKHNVIAAHHNVLKEEVKAIEQNISDRLGLSSTQNIVPVGSVSAPSVTFSGDLNTGLYLKAADSIGFAVGGTNPISVTTNGLSVTAGYNISLTSSSQLQLANGTVSAPGLTFANDLNSGLYLISTDAIALTVGGINSIAMQPGEVDIYISGAAKVAIDTNQVQIVPPIRIASGSATAPTFSFSSDPNTGIYNGAADYISFATAGVSRGRMRDDGIFEWDSQILFKGTATNDSASAGYFGQYVENIGGATSMAVTDVWYDVASISLTAGDWVVSAGVQWAAGNANTAYYAGISVNSGNSFTDAVAGDNYSYCVFPSGAYPGNVRISERRFSLATTTTLYMKAMATFTGTTPNARGRLSARRVR